MFFIFLCACANTAFAEGDLWDNFGDTNVYGQKPVTDEEFEKALESKKGKPKKPKDRLLRNGEAFQESNETEVLSKMPAELPILLVPANLEIKKEHLRLKCETETKNLLMKFRSHYLLYADRPQYLQKSFVPVVKTVNAIFKTVLRLKNIQTGGSAHDNITKIADLYECDTDFYELLLCYKVKYCNINKKVTIELADKIIEQLDKLLNYVNNL